MSAAETTDRQPSEPPEAAPEASEEPAEEPAEEAAEEAAEQEPPGEERWASFGPWQPPPPGRTRRVVNATGRGLARFFSHEWTLTVLGGVALAVLMTWPTLAHPRVTLPQDLGDPVLVAWILAWPGYALLNDPAQLWHTNAFYPDHAWSLAFTDSLLGYAPLSLLGEGMADALLRYNLVYVLAFALAFIGAYALLRQLGASPGAALVAAFAFAYAPWRLAQAGHLHVLSTGGIVLALAMLVRGHGWSLRQGFRPGLVRPGWIMAGWMVAAWQITIGFGIGLVFAYVLGLLVAVVTAGVLARWVIRRVVRWRGARAAEPAGTRPPVGWIVGANLVGGTLFAAVTLVMAVPYLTVVVLYPEAQRSLAAVDLFSPPLRGFLIAPAESWLWGEAHAGLRGGLFWAPEMTLLPGFVLLGLAVAGLFISIWSVRARLLLAAGVLVTVVLAMGTEAFDGWLYEPLFDHVPGWDALRTPGRLIIWITLLLGVLAAGAVTALAQRARELAAARGADRPDRLLRLAVLIPAVLVLAEGVGATPHPAVPPPPPALAAVDGPMLVLPSDNPTDLLVMLWTTDRFVPVVNGGSGFDLLSLEQTRQATYSFPDVGSVDHLRAIGVKTVVVLPELVVGTPWEGVLTAPGWPGVVREDTDGAIIFHLEAD